ncbi:glycosyltransferase family 2 protein [Helicobacter zhangjianzhongii]|uniref:glycosyltransferase family 2 protein n=1 Tax=Helicobacter zhangjianzhongii TaxID=2974574 RepID=UPI002556C52A|nr:glycosyltransferase family 2 protein [Helicobacter sp. CPD2-1]MDL0079256.1 glycosyltransferase [Helicobacter sp. CPD2-1]
MPKTQKAQSSSTTIFYGVGDALKDSYTKAEQYAIIAEVERRCKQYLDPSFDPTSFIYPRDNFALTANVESRCVFRQSLESSFDNTATNAHSVIRVRDSSGAAIHNKKTDSSKDYSASAEYMDCHADKSARNDRKNANTQSAAFLENEDSSNAHFSQADLSPSLRDTAPAVAWQSTAANEKLDSRARAVDSMDCHDSATAESRNDDKKVDSRENAAILNKQPKDSRILELESTFEVASSQAEARLDSSKSPSDSKILDEKCGLQGQSQGSYLSGNECSDCPPLPHFSLKAESPQAKKPLFTIAIPTYKRVTLLRRAILSALAQDFDEPYEIIVVENPLEPISYPAESMLQEFAHRITYYQNAQNIGGLGNWNRCLELARGEWVCLLHSDDELLPSYLARMSSLATNPAYAHATLIGAIEDTSDVYPRTRLQKLYAKCISQARLQKLQMQAPFEDGFCGMPPRALLHNRAKCIEIGGYDESEAPSGDMTFFNRAALCGEVFCYRAELLTRNHYDASSCKDPNVALMMILQNPQMILGFTRKLTHAQLVGNHLWWSRYFAHLPLLRLYAQMRLSQQFRLFGLRPSYTERSKQYVKEHCPSIFTALKMLKSLLTGRLSLQNAESSTQSEKVDSSNAQSLSHSTQASGATELPPPPPLDLLFSRVFVDPFLSSRVLSSRGLPQHGVAIHKSAKVDSSEVNSASAECMDCHADFQSARNDDKKVDSRFSTHNAPIFSDSQAAGFCDDFVGFQGGGEGIYLGDNEQAPAAESRKSAQKPTPKPSKAKSSKQQLMPKLARAS